MIITLKKGAPEKEIQSLMHGFEEMGLAAIAAGADGLIIEVHDDPEAAWSDGAQSLKPEKFRSLIDKGRKIAEVLGREMA